MPLMLGRKPRTFRPEIPHWSALRQMKAPVPIPDAKNWLDGMSGNFGMMLNDQLGDCTCAGMYHARQVWTFNASGVEVTEPDSAVLDAYEEACGYDPTNPATDEGGAEQNVLSWWTKTGLETTDGRDKLAAFIELDPRNLFDVKEAIYECGLVYIGFNVPNWLMASGQVPAVWDANTTGDNSIVGGHCVVLPGYDFSGSGELFDLISWGSSYQMTASFWNQFVDEAYALFDASWLAKTGKTPLGLTLAQAQGLMRAL